MVNEQQSKQENLWYVMRAYKSERKAEELLSGEHGLEYFIPKKQVLRTCAGRKVLCMEPVIHSLLFVYAAQQEIIEFKRFYYNSLQFVMSRDANMLRYLTVPTQQMSSFIQVCRQREEKVIFHKPGEIDLTKGQKVRVHGGTFDNVEGYFLKLHQRRKRQLVVLIPEVLAASAEVSTDYIQVID